VSLESRLRSIVGGAHLIVERDVLATYQRDWTGRFHGEARCVVRPADTEQVASVVRECAAAGVALCIQGGNTGLVGGSTPMDGSVLLSTRRLDVVGDVDSVAWQVTAGAGVTLAGMQRRVRAAGLDFGVDFAARDSCTVGGMAATNAGGERVLRYGATRAQLAGAVAVLADGSVLTRMSGLPKDNCGYDLTGLLCGSEGTLGVITELRLRLVPLLRARAVALLAVDGTAAALDALRALRESLPALEAAELFFPAGLDLVLRHGDLPAPFPEPHPAYLLVECADLSDPAEPLLDAIAQLPGLRDATTSADASGRRKLWAYREQHTEAISAEGTPVKLDVAVPVSRLAGFVAGLPGTVLQAAPTARTVLFGHLAEGNLHVNVLDALDCADAITEAVLTSVAREGGSVSAEHGVGRSKARWLHLSRSAAEVAAMRALKRALDPAGLLNPGVLLPDVQPS
jgi:FAD/FMN-containing dehydrogenase